MTRGQRKGQRSPENAAPRWLPRVEWGVGILLTLSALAFHVQFMTHAGALWRDEVNSVAFATLPSLSDIYNSLRYDSFPMLSTLMLRGWALVGLGHADWGYRLLGLIIGSGTLGALWLTSRILGCPVPLFSLALVGLAPWVIRTVDSIRPYGLGAMLIVLTLGFLWRAVITPAPGRFIAAGVLAVLSVQCMYQNAFLLLAITVGAAVAAWRASRPGTAITVGLVGLAAALSLIPYVPSMVAARSWTAVVQTPIVAWDMLAALAEALGAGGWVQVWLWLGLALLCVSIGVHALLKRAKQGPSKGPPSAAAFGAAVLIVATILFLATIQNSQLQPQPWYYVPLIVLVAPILDASAWGAARSTALRAVRLALVVAIVGATALPAWGRMAERRTNLDAIASHLEDHASPGDIIVVYPFWMGVTFHHYYQGTCRWITIPPIEDLRIHRFDLLKLAEARENPIDPVLEAMAGSLRSGHRVWLVGGLPEVSADQPAPSIPPAPHPTFGWCCDPYLAVWGQQVGHFLMTHALRGGPLPDLGRRPVSPYEVATLFVASGWR